jgi:hypothetical protein
MVDRRVKVTVVLLLKAVVEVAVKEIKNSAGAAEVGWLEADFVDPFFEYWHGEALSITGGDCSFLMS